MPGSEGRYSSSRDEGVRSRDGKSSGGSDRDRDRHREYKSHRDQSDHHTKRERTSRSQLKQHEQSSISKGHGCFKYSEYEMVTKTESEREKRRKCSDHNTKREHTSPKQELRNQLTISLSGPTMDAYVPPTAGSLLFAQVNPPLVTEDPPSECLVLKNVFDGSVEKWHEFYLDVKDFIHEQCAQFGPVQHIHVDKNLGYVYLRFDSKRTSTVAHKAFHGSSFDGRLITATFMSSRLYDSMFPDFWA